MKASSSFLNGVPELLVLKLLSRREMYGYEIVKAIRGETDEKLSFSEGCIYPYLHYLEDEKLVAVRRMEVEGRSRHYYRLTSRGRKRLEKISGDWARVSAGIESLLGYQHA